MAEQREKWKDPGVDSGQKEARAFAEARLRARAVYTSVLCSSGTVEGGERGIRRGGPRHGFAVFHRTEAPPPDLAASLGSERDATSEDVRLFPLSAVGHLASSLRAFLSFSAAAPLL